MLLADMPAGPLDLVICESCHKVMLGHRAATHAVTCRARQQLLLRAGDALRLPARDTKRTRTGPFGRGGLRASPPGGCAQADWEAVLLGEEADLSLLGRTRE